MAKTLLMETTEASWEFQFKQGYSDSENPDKVIAKKGMAYIEEIERDTHYSSVLNTRVQSVIGKGWKIRPYIDKKTGKIMSRDLEIADFVRDQLASIPTFETDIIAMFDHISKGFSLSEINYKKINSGKWRGKIGLKNIRKKETKLFSFRFDKLGYYKPVQINPGFKELELDKFIHFINGMNDENPYGESVGSKVAFWVWLKKNGAKFWAIYAERFGMPLGIVNVPDNIGTESAEYTKAKDVLNAMLKESGLIKPKNFDVELLEAMRPGSADYDGFLKRCNAEISKIVLGQTLATDEGVKGQGTHAQASVHAGVLTNYTLFDVIVSAAAINYQLIRRLVDLNFVTEHYPIFEWKNFDISRLTVLAQNIRNLIDAGLKVPAKFIYDEIGIDMPEENEEILEIKDKEIVPSKTKGIDNKATTYNQFAENDKFALLEAQNQLFVNANEKMINEFKPEMLNIYDNLKKLIKKNKKISPDTIAKFMEKNFPKFFEKIMTAGYLQGLKFARQQIELSQDIYFKFKEEIEYNPIEDLLKELLELEVITKSEFKLLTKEIRRKAFTIAGIEQEYILDAIRNEIGSAIETGGNWVELGNKIDDIMEKAGINALEGNHLETVIRNNVLGQYSEARERLYNDLDEEEFPTKSVLPIMDSATREGHKKLYKFTRPKNDPIWDILKTPFAHNCRCIIVANTKDTSPPISNWTPDLTGKDFLFINNGL